MIYPIILYGSNVLRKKADDIKKDEIDVKKLSDDMFETMENADGIGLAAPQIGISKRIFVVDGTLLEDEQMKNFKKVFINPMIISETGEDWGFEEGCLSIPETTASIKRASYIKLLAADIQGEKIEVEAEGLLSVCIQHEIDHLKGVLFIDYLSRLKRDRIARRILKAEREMS